jgi:Leucine-rich repeat (LRR) protein
VCLLPNLRQLDISKNQLTELPNLEKLSQLQFIWLKDNRFCSLPDRIGNIQLTYSVKKILPSNLKP